MSVLTPHPTAPVLDGCSQSQCVQGEGVGRGGGGKGMGGWGSWGKQEMSRACMVFLLWVAVSGCHCANI